MLNKVFLASFLVGLAVQTEVHAQSASSERTTFSQPRVTNRVGNSTREISTMQDLMSVPPYPGKIKFLGGRVYLGDGAVISVNFVAAHDIAAIMRWYEEALTSNGWSCTKSDLGYAAHLTAKKPSQSATLSIQLLSAKAGEYRTRVYIKESVYSQVSTPMIGGGSKREA